MMNDLLARLAAGEVLGRRRRRGEPWLLARGLRQGEPAAESLNLTRPEMLEEIASSPRRPARIWYDEHVRRIGRRRLRQFRLDAQTAPSTGAAIEAVRRRCGAGGHTFPVGRPLRPSDETVW